MADKGPEYSNLDCEASLIGTKRQIVIEPLVRSGFGSVTSANF